MGARSPEQHLQAIGRHLNGAGWRPRSEHVPVGEALGRVLAADVAAQIDSPAFDNSQMDGYAVGADQLGGGEFRLVATIPAGADPTEIWPAGVGGEQVAAVMTGGRLPQGCVAVVPVEACQPSTFEEVEADPARKVRIPATSAGSFVRGQASDMAAGTRILRSGQVIDPLVMAVLVQQKLPTVEVYRAPRVVICTGGDETAVDAPVDARFAVADVNGPMLRELCAAWGIDVAGHVHTSDNISELRAKLQAVLAGHEVDCIITSGGISHGRFEVFRQLLGGAESNGQASAGRSTGPGAAWFGHVAQQPGGPQGIATFEGVPVICLPGNPISTLVSFRLFVVPALSPRFAGAAAAFDQLGSRPARLLEAVEGLADNREQFRRAIAQLDASGRLTVRAVGAPGSHFLAQAVTANCLLRVGAGARLQAEDTVSIYPMEPWTI